ncbi:MAG: hypothetical protein RR415_07485 [Ruthenibacterium sp.]
MNKKQYIICAAALCGAALLMAATFYKPQNSLPQIVDEPKNPTVSSPSAVAPANSAVQKEVEVADSMPAKEAPKDTAQNKAVSSVSAKGENTVTTQPKPKPTPENTAQKPTPAPEPAPTPTPPPAPAPEPTPPPVQEPQHYHGNGTDTGTCPVCGGSYSPAIDMSNPDAGFDAGDLT